MAELNNQIKKSKKKSKKNKEFIKLKDEEVDTEETNVDISLASGISSTFTPKKSKKVTKENIKEREPFNPKKLNRGVVLVRSIPHGFYEEQLHQFFSQFGKVTRTRVARSRRTGKSKRLAYVEFRVPEVAKIAAETMDNYLMFKQRLHTLYISPKERKYNYFNTSVKYIKVNGKDELTSDVITRRENIIKSYNKIITDEQHKKKIEHFEKLISRTKAKYEAIDGVKIIPPVIYREIIMN